MRRGGYRNLGLRKPYYNITDQYCKDQIIKLQREGLDPVAIQERLGIAPETYRKHLYHLANEGRL